MVRATCRSARVQRYFFSLKLSANSSPAILRKAGGCRRAARPHHRLPGALLTSAPSARRLASAAADVRALGREAPVRHHRLVQDADRRDAIAGIESDDHARVSPPQSAQSATAHGALPSEDRHTAPSTTRRESGRPMSSGSQTMDRYRVKPGSHVKLEDWDASDTGAFKARNCRQTPSSPAKARNSTCSRRCSTPSTSTSFW